MNQIVICGFCGKKVKVERFDDGKIVVYRCTECDSLIAAYQREFEKTLKLGNLFRKYPIGHYQPSLPHYIKAAKES